MGVEGEAAGYVGGGEVAVGVADLGGWAGAGDLEDGGGCEGAHFGGFVVWLVGGVYVLEEETMYSMDTRRIRGYKSLKKSMKI